MARVEQLKQALGATHQEKNALQRQIEQYRVEYTQFIAQLENERFDLEQRIHGCQYQIQILESGSEVREWQEPEEITIANDLFEDDPIYQEKIIDDEPFKSTIQPRDNISAANKRHTYHFFAQLFHPDRMPESPLNPLPISFQQLTLINEKAMDEIDLLIEVPWSKEWLKRGENEKPGNQLERLMGWVDGLEEGQHRLEQELNQLKRDVFYEGLRQKQEAETRGEDHFAEIAHQKVEENKQLRQNLANLQTYLRALQNDCITK